MSCERRLAVVGGGVVNRGLDALAGEPLPEVVAIGVQADAEVGNGIRAGGQQGEVGAVSGCPIARRRFLGDARSIRRDAAA